MSDDDRAILRGAGLGCALAGFALLVAAQVLPWASATTTPMEQDFPTSTGGRVENGLAELSVPHEMFNLGWLIVLAAVAAALAAGPPLRRIARAVGLGLLAGQLAMLVGITYWITHSPIRSSMFSIAGQMIRSASVSQHVDIGVYCGYGALALFAVALLLAGGVPRRFVADEPADSAAEEDDAPTDLTVTPVPDHDPAAWARPELDIRPRSDINVGEGRSDR